MIYLDLFLSFLKIGCLSFGGGYAAMPLIQDQIVESHNWLTMDAFTNLITIAEMTPGPIAVNAATFVGTQVAGPMGAIIATIGCVLPSCIFVTMLACLYAKYSSMALLQGTLQSLRPAVIAMIAKAGVSILVTVFFINSAEAAGLSNVSLIMVAYFVCAFFALRKFKLNPILVMVLCGVAELIHQIIKGTPA